MPQRRLVHGTVLQHLASCLEGRYLLFHRSHAAKPLKFSTSRVTQLYGNLSSQVHSVSTTLPNIYEAPVEWHH